MGKSVNELIQELRYHARYSKNGKMDEECVVSKALLADAADNLEEFLNNETVRNKTEHWCLGSVAIWLN